MDGWRESRDRPRPTNIHSHTRRWGRSWGEDPRAFVQRQSDHQVCLLRDRGTRGVSHPHVLTTGIAHSPLWRIQTSHSLFRFGGTGHGMSALKAPAACQPTSPPELSGGRSSDERYISICCMADSANSDTHGRLQIIQPSCGNPPQLLRARPRDQGYPIGVHAVGRLMAATWGCGSAFPRHWPSKGRASRSSDIEQDPCLDKKRSHGPA